MEENKKEQKLSYEQLTEVANQLASRNDMLVKKIQEINSTTIFKRMDYLFQVVANSDKFTPEFVCKCTEELETILTLPVEEEKVEG